MKMTNEQIARSLSLQLYAEYLKKPFQFIVCLRFIGDIEAMVVEVVKGLKQDYAREDVLFLVDQKKEGECIVDKCLEIIKDYVDENEREGNL